MAVKSNARGMIERAVADSVIAFLEGCGEVDIEAGVGALLGLGSPGKIRHFKEGLGRAAFAAVRDQLQRRMDVLNIEAKKKRKQKKRRAAKPS